jgi:malate dehydrogenase (oxaloacetate-decarboxylating)(NADP+)
MNARWFSPCPIRPAHAECTAEQAYTWSKGKAIYAAGVQFPPAARAVADQVPADLLKQGLLYPLQSNILEAEIQTAARVAKLVFDSGLARVKQPADMVAFIRQHVYKPEYKEVAA